MGRGSWLWYDNVLYKHIVPCMIGGLFVCLGFGGWGCLGLLAVLVRAVV